MLVEPLIDGVAASYSTLGRGMNPAGDVVISRRQYGLKSHDMQYEVVDPISGLASFRLYSTWDPQAQVGGADASEPARLRGKQLALSIFGDGSVPPGKAGRLYGAIMFDISSDAAPFVWTRKTDDDGLNGSYGVTASGLLVHHADLSVYPPSGGAPTQIYTAAKDPEGLPGYVADVRDADVIISVNAAGRSGVYSWTPTSGLRPFLRVPFDIKRAWGSIGGDGRDLVWMYAEGQPTSEYVYPKRTVFTAPWTADPDKVAATARSLGPDDSLSSFAQRFVVGCGYAVREDGPISGSTGVAGVTVIRLADGARWLLPNDTPAAFIASAVTCEHVYLSMLPARPFRIRLDSLGPPLAPP